MGVTGIAVGIGIGPFDTGASRGSSFLLDDVSGAAIAFSTRKLREAYAGNCIEVRRSSDNTTQDIGFTATGDLDTSALTTFVGAGNGFVRTWYDQSGNGRNATQTTNINQPQIVSSGSVIVDSNGNPVLSGVGVSPRMNVTSFTHNQPIYRAVYVKFNSASKYALDGNGINSHALGLDLVDTTVELTAGNVLQYTHGSSLAGVELLVVSLANGTSSSIKVNDNTASTGDAGTTNAAGISLFNRADGAFKLDGFIGEVVEWASDKSSDQGAILSNMNAHWGAY